MNVVRQRPARQPDAEPLARPAEPDDERIVREHASSVFRFVRSLGASRDVADEVTQEAFVAAWQKGKQRLPAPAMATFLRRAARFAWLQRRRTDRRAEAAIADLAEATWVAECGDDGSSQVEAARACLALLQGRAARAVQLAYGDGASRDTIAVALGMAQNGVKTLLARTRKWLAECIEKQRRNDA